MVRPQTATAWIWCYGFEGNRYNLPVTGEMPAEVFGSFDQECLVSESVLFLRQHLWTIIFPGGQVTELQQSGINLVCREWRVTIDNVLKKQRSEECLDKHGKLTMLCAVFIF